MFNYYRLNNSEQAVEVADNKEVKENIYKLNLYYESMEKFRQERNRIPSILEWKTIHEEIALEKMAKAYPDLIIKQETMIGSGNLPKFKDNLYRDDETDLWLIPTAEVSLNGLHQGKIITPASLPKSYVARTPSFRKEHTSAGRDIRGIKRVHQFYKVEMFKYVHPDDSEEHLESMIDNARTLCDRLELSSKLIQLSTGDIGFQSAITFDIEVWAAGSKEWLEVSSISNCYDFQSRRNNTRYKETQASSTIFPHTLNGSGLALPRIWVAIIENGQQEDGSIKIPEVLIPYTGFESI